MSDVRGPLSSKQFHFQFISRQKSFPKGLRILLRCVLAKFRPVLMSFMDANFGQCLSYSGVMNSDLYWCKRGLQTFDVVLASFVAYWMRLGSWRNFGMSVTSSGKVCYCTDFFFHLEIIIRTVVLPRAFNFQSPSSSSLLEFLSPLA